KDKEDVRHHLEKRIKAYYKTGPIGIMNVAFSSETLPELLRFHDSFQSLLAYDNQVIKNYRGVINDLQMGNKMLFWEKGVMDGFIRQTITDKDAIFEIRQEKEKLLSQIRSRKQLHERAIKEMEKATDSMLANLNVLQKKDELLGKGFLLAKGTLPWPALGPVVTRFGEKKTNMLGITKKSTGISIQAPNGSPIRAVFEGKILYSSYLRGYGNTIIIDHGDNHYSIVSRLERLLKKKGRQVSQSEIIGFSGTTGALFDDGIHFEIRRGKQVQNPLAWLEKNSH
ncbi:MAG: M23 family metallopeptidase, partial [Thermodesulfobacteriota bacterium]